MGKSERAESWELCDEAGIKGFCLHVLRHAFAMQTMEIKGDVGI